MRCVRSYRPVIRARARALRQRGYTHAEICARLGQIPKATLANWVAAAKRGTLPKAAPGSRTVPELEAEVTKLRRELAEVRMERDIVKKAAAYFARESLPSTR